MNLTINWIIWGIAMFLKLYFAMSETALFASDRLELARRQQNGNLGAGRCLAFLTDTKSLLSGLLVGTNLSMVVATVTAANISDILQPFGSQSEAITTILMIVLVLYATELVPKGYAVRAPETIACLLSGPLSLMLRILRPVARPFDVLAAQVVKILDSPAYQELQGDETIITLAELSSESGQITEDTEEMIAAVLTNDDRRIAEVMRPRVDIEAIDIDGPWPEILDTIGRFGYSRWPVYEEDIDQIVGLLYRRDLLPLLLQNDEEQLPPLRDLLRPALFVPEMKRISEQLREMREAHCHMAIVLDEYGSTAGLVTLEDLLEEVFGEIQDETDPDQVELLQELPQDQGKGILADASLPLSELEDVFDLPQSLANEPYTSVGGFLFGELGRLPDEGERVEMCEYGLEFTVRKLEGYRIVQVEIRALETPQEAP